ncbi:MAG: Ig-like domain-containing protein, partial [Gemmataceae bacterium]|nr:Ig-like domain-containing protein [Gemmataceae bacterium]
MTRLAYLFASAVALSAPAASFGGEPPSFLTDVVPLLTKAGCNQGACHGKGAGQNGFRLSLRGFAPGDDYKWITREFGGRRLDRTRPEESLLLRKATSQTPHEGGRLFTTSSREYALLLDWIKAGYPGPDWKETPISKLELAPATSVLKPGESVQLTAIAHFSNGSKRDVTWLTKFDSNDPAYLEVSPGGKAKALRNGASAVRAMYLTEVAVTVFSMPFDRPVDEKRFQGGSNFIDTPVLAKLKELRIEPSDLCTDEEFIRRLFLDACGLMPTAAEVTAFLADADPNKRAKLIDAVLERP